MIAAPRPQGTGAQARVRARATANRFSGHCNIHSASMHALPCIALFIEAPSSRLGIYELFIPCSPTFTSVHHEHELDKIV
jgi:hypothetical protein